MIAGVSVYEILIISTIVFFIGVYGFLTRKNLISILLSVELILNSVAINFVVFNKYLFPGDAQGVFFTLFLIAVAAAEVAIAIAIVIDLYRLVKTVNVDETTEMKY
jgi:NADH-quinone oxidoreductase subunit K